MVSRVTRTLLLAELRGLQSRLDGHRAFVVRVPTVPAASVSREALLAVDRYLERQRAHLERLLAEVEAWMESPAGRSASGEVAQRRLVAARLRFNRVMTHLDIFSDAITQRADTASGLLLSGLDALADDMLRVRGLRCTWPPVMSYLDRGSGAAIRRAQTRLPGGGSNPVAIVRVPRERMVGVGVASSLCHEIGHQAAAYLELVRAIRPALAARAARGQIGAGTHADPFAYWHRWLSEIVADCWSISRCGVGQVLGLIAVVSLPPAFVVRGGLDDPHPIPWIRVKLCCALGAALYPDPQWERLARAWEEMYPMSSVKESVRPLIGALNASLGEFVRILLGQRPARLRGHTLGTLMHDPARTADALRAQRERCRRLPEALAELAPSMAFAVVGQARADDAIDPKTESEILTWLLEVWAQRRVLAESRSSQGSTRMNPTICEMTATA